VDRPLAYPGRVRTGLRIAAALIGAAALQVTGCAPPPRPSPPASAVAPSNAPALAVRDCAAAGWEPAAQTNAASLRGLAWSPFGRDELGWSIYAPLIAREIGAACPPDSPAFARALATWQQGQGVAPDGLVSAVTFVRLKGVLQGRRPFVLLAAEGVCAAAADETRLAVATADEALGDKPVELRPRALAAYRRMVAAARTEAPEIAVDPDLLKIFSGYRRPDYDAARCAVENNCNGRERAVCSAHRTGLAMDLYLGHAPGYAADSSADPNRLFMTEGAAYRWLVANADRFGFVNYPFEPWHWEWTGEAPAAATVTAGGSPGQSTRSAGP
jgi:hypothetical protein